MKLNKKSIKTDVLIIGAGTAGCYAALTLSKMSNLSVTVAEKANIKRSGCLAAGVNAINAYITKGKVPEDYVNYATKDANGIVRCDLLLSVAERFNGCTREMEKLGLVILKDENGDYVTRGDRNIKINGENFKPILASAVSKCENVSVINNLNITDLIVNNDNVVGAVGFSIKDNTAYTISAKAVLISTGGASGVYKPNNPGFSKHKMWYPPFNTGAGYAMALKAGAEMTTFEMRFIALRCKDTIAPTGTIAQGVGAKQVNAKGEVYETKYGITTSERVYGTVEENVLGNGPCYLKTLGIENEKNESLIKAYLNMAPSQTLKWIESGKNPNEQNVEICGTEPYIVGGHTASGIWVDTMRRSTVKGLYAAGDVAGGCPQKYVTGALAEGEIAAEAIVNDFCGLKDFSDTSFENKIAEYESFLNNSNSEFSVSQIEEAMQKVMDEYAGGISANYRFNMAQLNLATEKINILTELANKLSATDMHELMFIYELKERLLVALTLLEHLKARKETRWHTFNENLDYPNVDDDYECYINSVYKDGKISTFKVPLVKGDYYEHSN